MNYALKISIISENLSKSVVNCNLAQRANTPIAIQIIPFEVLPFIYGCTCFTLTMTVRFFRSPIGVLYEKSSSAV